MCYKIDVTYNMVALRPEKYQIAGHDEYNEVCKDMRFVWIVDESFLDDANWPSYEHEELLIWRCITDAYAHGWQKVRCSVVRIIVRTMKGDIIWDLHY